MLNLDINDKRAVAMEAKTVDGSPKLPDVSNQLAYLLTYGG